MSDVAFAGIARLTDMVRAGDIAPTDLVELFLDQIDRLDSELNAYATKDNALEAAGFSE
jgi:Asp-tRNA(Asn)/Glu-tRNA(Gln) amidotransferase A subunit family amidase